MLRSNCKISSILKNWIFIYWIFVHICDWFYPLGCLFSVIYREFKNNNSSGGRHYFYLGYRFIKLPINKSNTSLSKLTFIPTFPHKIGQIPDSNGH